MGELISPASTWRYIHWCSGIWTHLRWKERSFGLQDDNLVHFLTTVSLQEFIIRHVATTDSDNELVVHDLSVNLTASELKAYACRWQVSMNKCRYEGAGLKWNEWMNEWTVVGDKGKYVMCCKCWFVFIDLSQVTRQPLMAAAIQMVTLQVLTWL